MDDHINLTAITPIDGRYRSVVTTLSEYFSEAALIKNRVYIEVEYLIFIIPLLSKIKLSPRKVKYLRSIYQNFGLEHADEVKKIETKIHHDVKAVEYFLADKIKVIDPRLIPYIHIALTSEDTNSISYGLMLKSALENVIFPKIRSVMEIMTKSASEYGDIVMLGRTHGQPAVPTTFGKEIAVYVNRLKYEYSLLSKIGIQAKLNGAVGNYNAQILLAPNVDWITVTSKFIKSFGLEPEFITTQIIHYDSYIRVFRSLFLINQIMIGLVQDFWRYISDGYLVQNKSRHEVGSSTMPQKVNPIDFENCEGNLGLANSLFHHFSVKLPVSRLQRDLSDSTVKRSFGSSLAYSLIAYESLLKGLSKVRPNPQIMRNDLQTHWEIITEGIQSVLRLCGQSDAYEKLRVFAQGNNISRSDIREFIGNLDIPPVYKKRLMELDPPGYVGLSGKLVKMSIKTVKGGNNAKGTKI